MRFQPSAWILAALLAAAAVAIGISHRMCLDDALIHLRIAHQLLAHGFYSFNGDVLAYSTSSPLYTALLAARSFFFPGPMLPKVLGELIYAVVILALAMRATHQRTAAARWLTVAFVAAVASPIGVRWLADGMETGLTAAMALIYSRIAYDISRGEARGTWASTVLIAALAMLATLLRVEFGFLAASILAAEWAQRRSMVLHSRAFALCCGAALGLGLIYWIFGSLLPDTAIAKAALAPNASPASEAVATLFNVVKTQAAASLFGALLLLCLILSFLLARRRRVATPFTAVLNASLLAFVALIVVRHQAVQGIRYFVFLEFFLVSFNLYALDGASPETDSWPISLSTKLKPWAITCAALAGIAWYGFDFSHLRLISAGRTATFERFRELDLSDLRGRAGIAWDVGMIGYFSDGYILDGNGLVNGRRIAQASMHNRLKEFVRDHQVDFVFANAEQAQELMGLLSTRDWIARGTFDFPNFDGAPDRHVLLTRPTAVR
jgi:hypothetical protein